MSWPIVLLGDVAATVRNGLFARRPSDLPPGVRILRISAVRDGQVEMPGCRYVDGLTDDQVAKFTVDPCDILMTRYNGSRNLVGAAGLVPPHDGPVIHPDKLIRIVLDPAVADARFVNHQLQSPAVREFLEPRIRTTAGQSGIAGADVRAIPIALPDLDIQYYIVNILEGHLHHLDAAESYLSTCALRCRALLKSVLQSLVPDVAGYPNHWVTSTVAEAGRVELGRQRHPDWHTGPNMRPYLRVANVFEDRIDHSDLKEMHWPDETFERFRLYPGDVLLNEGQSRELLGRPAIYRDDPPVVGFTNTLLRFRPHDGILSEFALLVFRRHMHAGRFAREARITTNIGHLSAARLKPIEFPIPPVVEQAAIVANARERLRAISALENEVVKMANNSAVLRRSLLSEVFTGRLTRENAGQAIAEELITA